MNIIKISHRLYNIEFIWYLNASNELINYIMNNKTWRTRLNEIGPACHSYVIIDTSNYNESILIMVMNNIMIAWIKLNGVWYMSCCLNIIPFFWQSCLVMFCSLAVRFKKRMKSSVKYARGYSLKLYCGPVAIFS